MVGDVHGDAAAFGAAIEGAAALGLFVVQLGDLTDHGPDSPGALRLAFGLIDSAAGMFLLGNHDHRLRRALTGRQTDRTHGLQTTLDQIAADPDGAALTARTLDEIARAPAWAGLRATRFVHAAWHPAMEHGLPPPDAGAARTTPPVARAIYGEISGRSLANGFPERLHGWIDLLPPGLTVFCGHERRDLPTTWPGEAGGQVRFLDTGAGKGGYLSWQDLRWEDLG
ncbi:metallophosphoesterase [Humitalea sp. 24SJ18S-53]|uniref:metallophosphoesterase n=1 Tax=Humitalea sp. 24SJ18S-53 TaxID=3422307 RepID=UPI003D66577E